MVLGKQSKTRRYFVAASLICLSSFGVRDVKAQDGDIFVLGGNRGIGLEIVKLLRDRGENVTVLVRASSDTTELERTGAAMVIGDAMDRATIDAGLSTGSFRIFISTIKGRTQSGERADAAGNVNAVDAAKAAGVPYFMLLSTIGAGDSIAALPPPLRAVLQGSIDAKNVAESHLTQSGLDYTVIRPGGLKISPSSGRGVLLSDESVLASIGRAELAKLVVGSLYDTNARGKIYSAIVQ